MGPLRFDQATRLLFGDSGHRRTVLAVVAAAALKGAVGDDLKPVGTGAKKKKRKKPQLKLAFQCPGPGDGFLALGAGTRVGQVFTAARTGTLRQVRIPIFNEPGDEGDFVVQLLVVVGIRGDEAHNPVPDLRRRHPVLAV